MIIIVCYLINILITIVSDFSIMCICVQSKDNFLYLWYVTLPPEMSHMDTFWDFDIFAA